MRVLVAEDDEHLGEVLARGLREQGYTVDLARDGETAGTFLRMYEYAVAVIDWRMPRLSGLDLVRQLRQRQARIGRAGPHADRQGHAGGPDRRPGRRRR